MSEPPAFRYRAIPDDHRPFEIFASDVEYLVGDELPLTSGRWQVQRVVQAGVKHQNGHLVTVRTLYCSVTG